MSRIGFEEDEGRGGGGGGGVDAVAAACVNRMSVSAETLREANRRIVIRFVVLDSCFSSMRRLCCEVVKRRYYMPSCLSSCVFSWLRQQVQRRARFDLNECDWVEGLRGLSV